MSNNRFYKPSSARVPLTRGTLSFKQPCGGLLNHYRELRLRRACRKILGKRKVPNKCSAGRVVVQVRRKSNRLTRAQRLKSAWLLFGVEGVRCESIVCQSGLKFTTNQKRALQREEHRRLREAREEQQRLAAKEKRKQAYKQQDKVLRQAAVSDAKNQAARDKVEAAHGDYVNQGFGSFLGKAALAVAGVFGVRKVTKGTINHVKDMAVTLMMDVINKVESVFGKAWLGVIASMIVIWLVLRIPNPTLRITIALALLAVVAGRGLKKYANMALHYITGVPDILNQSTNNIFGTALAGLMCMAVFKSGVTRSGTTEFMKRIAVFDRAATGATSFVEWLLKSMRSMVSYVLDIASGGRIKVFKEVKQPFEVWRQKVDTTVKKYKTYSEKQTNQEADELLALLQEGFEFKEVFRGTAMERTVCTAISELHMCLRPYASAIAARNNCRFEPRMAVFCGDPGIGKTMLSTRIVATILKMGGIAPDVKTSDELAKHVWQKGTSKYWNGYANQSVLIMDDAFQMKAALMDEENDFLHTVKAVTSWSFPLNMADLDSKGRIYFNSKFIYATTNVDNIQSEAFKVLQCPEAVTRRFTFPYKLFLKAEYKRSDAPYLDMAKFDEESKKLAEAGKKGFESYPWHMWECARHDFMTGRTEEERKPLRDVVVMMANDMRERLEAHNKGIGALDSFLSDISEPGSPEDIVNQAKGAPMTLEEAKATYERLIAEEENKRKELTFEQKFCRNFMIGMALGFVVRILGSTVKMLANCLFGKDKDEIENQSLHKPPNTRPGLSVPIVVNQSVIPYPEVQKGPLTAANASVYALVVLAEGQLPRQIGHLLFVNSSLAVLPKHYRIQLTREVSVGQVADTDSISVVNVVNPSFAFNVPVGVFQQLPGKVDADQDHEFIDFAKLKIRAHRNITNLFIKESDIKRYSGCAVRLDVPCLQPNGTTGFRVEHCPRVMLHGLLPAPVPMKRCWRYPTVVTHDGECGSILSLTDGTNASGRVLMGIHCAASVSTHDGFATIITQEAIREAQNHFSTPDDQFLTDIRNQGYSVTPAELPFEKPGTFMSIGKIEEKYNLPRKTKLYAIPETTGMFGDYAYSPARMAPFKQGDKTVFPMLNAVEPYSGPIYHYMHPFVDQAVHIAMQKFDELSQYDTREIFSVERAVLGDPFLKIRAIPRNTSPGFPHALTVKNGKRSFFGEGQDYDLSTEEFETVTERVGEIIAAARHNTRLAHVFIDFLKDELRSDEKVKAGKTRLISCAPMEYTIAVRMYFGAFSSAFFRHHTESGMCPGICAYTDWDALARHLQQKGTRVFDGDFKAFDSSEQADILERLCDYINRWYDDGPVNARIRKILFMELSHSRHLGGDGTDQCYIYQWNRSLPSGHPLTTVVNSMYCLFTLVHCYIAATGDWTGFWDHVSAATYGDDNVVNPDESVCDRYNQVTVSQLMASNLGMTYTSGRKDGKLEPYTTLDKITFLQRGFRIEKGRVLSPLNPDSFLYTCYWGKNRQLQQSILIDVFENALEELSQHPPEMWEKYAPKIIAYLRKNAGRTRTFPEREAYQTLIRSYTDHWY